MTVYKNNQASSSQVSLTVKEKHSGFVDQHMEQKETSEKTGTWVRNECLSKMFDTDVFPVHLLLTKMV